MLLDASVRAFNFYINIIHCHIVCDICGYVYIPIRHLRGWERISFIYFGRSGINNAEIFHSRCICISIDIFVPHKICIIAEGKICAIVIIKAISFFINTIWVHREVTYDCAIAGDIHSHLCNRDIICCIAGDIHCRAVLLLYRN